MLFSGEFATVGAGKETGTNKSSKSAPLRGFNKSAGDIHRKISGFSVGRVAGAGSMLSRQTWGSLTLKGWMRENGVPLVFLLSSKPLSRRAGQVRIGEAEPASHQICVVFGYC
jgi:hypothetical protein